MSEDIVLVKKQIKEWERNFIKTRGHPPSKSDVKGNLEIDQLYRRYRKLKAPVSSQTQPKKQTPKKPKVIDNIKGLSDDDSETEGPSVTRFSEFGPTPQGAGKVLSIFDMKLTPPESSPLKLKSMSLVETPMKAEFKTPTKVKVIDTNVLHSGSRSNKSSFMQKISNIANDSPVKSLSTPSKSQTLSFETPQYLNRNIQRFEFDRKSPFEKEDSPFDPKSSPVRTPNSKPLVDFQISPSPLIKRTNRRLLDVFQAHQSINISKEEQEEYEDDEESEEEGEEVSASPSKRRRAKTQKRTTRRYKMKPTQVTHHDKLADKDIHVEMEKLEKKEELKIQKMIDDNVESASEESEEEQQPTKKVRMVAPVHNNYKRMKIHYKKNKNWGRRR
ncbi:DNA replication regulator Sld2p [[Candida] jaroonii]|uniref:DNA replication regulator Sld2p n=1 Tax=[Candida] jaroonii TaxID=467808 RepID=A0ACA9Y4S4_9ASCO|nr:DNA replication regulator Sld2p [[Candida] jaroonii]